MENSKLGGKYKKMNYWSKVEWRFGKSNVVKLHYVNFTLSMNDAKLKIIEAVKMMTPLIPNNTSPSGSNKTSKPELVLV
jgi:hypothetical protein